MNEKQIIERYFKQINIDNSVHVGSGDDAAVLNLSDNHQLVVSTDSMVIGRHFLPTSDPYNIGYKLMAVNISDMAAMGATPRWVTLNLTLPEIDESWLKAFAEGFNTCAQQANVLLIGGDLTSGTETNISAQILGEVPVNKALLRSQAEVNDLIYVTGRIGLAGSALTSLRTHDDDHSQLSASQMKALYQPESRIALGCELRRFAHAAIDVSDGLLHDLELICHASGVGAELDIDRIPVTEEIDILNAITAGDDYELLFTAAEKYQTGIELLSHQHACPITQIGKISTGSGQVDLFQHGQKISRPKTTGFDHFTQTS